MKIDRGLIASTLFAAVVAAACGERIEPPVDDGDPALSAEFPDAQPDTTPPPGSPPGAVVGGDDVLLVNLTLTEWGIESSHDRIAAGPVTFAIANRGEQSHSVQIVKEEGGQWRSTIVAPNGTIQMGVSLGRGEYRIICPEDDGAHAERGMSRRLVVQ